MLAAVSQMMQRDLTQRLMSLVAILAVCGIVVSSTSLQHHYAKSKTAYCDIGETFNCDIVNRSEYSSILGIPVALIGMLGYAALAGLATLYRERRETPAILFAGAAAGLAFALYLTYIEGHVLGVWCILCLSSLALIATMTILSGLIWWRGRNR
ncbi:MAG TPA: vitamin K epoxide reductase family protein [Terriglobales bacterium]|jgi:vitamin-K-epoxide reductase (warfarin-sensitive)|nr:vitamin K epoxide reductase family protein [Terriglobales bacterium]